jgi:hypothetical protein
VWGHNRAASACADTHPACAGGASTPATAAAVNALLLHTSISLRLLLLVLSGLELVDCDTQLHRPGRPAALNCRGPFCCCSFEWLMEVLLWPTEVLLNASAMLLS